MGAIIAATVAASAAESTPTDTQPAPLRIAYNYCTLSYTFAYYGREDWTKELDRLAKAGYNVALLTDGTFKVWQLTLRELGYSEKDILDFIPDECARAWWLMGNLTGEGGPLDQATIDEDGERGKWLAAEMKKRGIEPILQGYTGMMPLIHPGTIAQGPWSVYERPPILDPTGEEYAKVAGIWHRNLEKVYGIKPKYLAGDLFHEGGKTAGIDVTAATRAVQAAQQAAFPGVTWIVQAWQANPTKEVRAGLDPRFTLIEALVKDMSAFNEDDSVCSIEFGDLPWVWCEVLNFGGNHGLYGNLKTFSRLGRAAKGPGAKTFRGYGSLSEGFFTNPVCYDLFEEMMMRPKGSEMEGRELRRWLHRWIARRYGFADSRLFDAWHILEETVYACNRCQEGTVENVICAIPAWDANNASTWGPKGGLWYDPKRLEEAIGIFNAVLKERILDGALPDVPELNNINCDIYDLERQIAANRMRALMPSLKDHPEAREDFVKAAKTISQDSGNAPSSFRLSTYESQARRRAGDRGAKAFRRMVTTWTDPKYGTTTLSDYANREYTELIRDVYLPRWEKFFACDGEEK